ncbi:lipocalin family protein [Mesoterricola sediminis]|uniref:Outer membrane lipoprotein n=1 Tax=Mesoterricola sediminis TaxID=2927980 RepID=A0AA48KDZ7_9BACT|nr:lipocalin family protein [Mesoterricola sediminis]BDU77555.1 outer membrane lipoprotein [Mesoterricola sediminis]
MKPPPLILLSTFAAALLALAACRTPARVPLRTVPAVDLPRFMGDWYVIACIPTFLERGIANAVESYRLDPDGTVATTFTYRKGGPDGPPGRMTPRGFVLDPATNAVWGMRFVWPVKADYRIIHVDPDYAVTVVAREKRDYAWIMARRPAIPEPVYDRMVQLLREAGYDVTKLRRIPQRWVP